MQIEDREKQFFKYIVNFFSGTFLSRFTGMLREIVMAIVWGTNMYTAAFWLSFRILFFFRRILGETILSMAFIPHFEFLRLNDYSLAIIFFKDIEKFLFKVTIVFCIVFEIILGSMYFFKKSPVLLLTMLLIPSSIFLVLYAINTVFLYCEKIYFLPGSAPVAVNCVWICVTLLSRNLDCFLGIKILCSVLFVGFFLQWLITLKKKNNIVKNYVKTSSQDFFKNCITLLKPFFLGVLGIAACQFNGILDMFLASSVSKEAPSFFWYAMRIQQLPVSLFSLGISSVLLPSISKSVQKSNFIEAKEHLLIAIKNTVTLVPIVSIFMFMLAFSGISLIYGYNSFSVHAVEKTSKILQAYAVGLIPMIFSSILTLAFYGEKQYDFPLKISFLAIALNIILSRFLLFIFPESVESLAWATSIVSWVQVFFLKIKLQKMHEEYKGLLISYKKLCYKILLISVGTICCFYTLDPIKKSFFAMLNLCSFRRNLSVFCFEFLILFIFIKSFSFLLECEELLVFLNAKSLLKRLLKKQ